MGRINLGRVILGGIVAGIIINAFEYVLNGVLLADQWSDMMKTINRPELGTGEVGGFMALGMVQGLVAVWTYAAIRPRFGEGPMTAVCAAVLTWITSYALVDAMLTIMGVFDISLTLMLVGVGLVEIVIATLAGAYIYKE